MKKQLINFFNLIIVLFSIFNFSSCQSASVIHDYWWNNYRQGIIYSGQYLWKEAEENFKMALTDRFDDKLYASTYGRHLIHYFPHRELGCVYFHQERYEEAIKELETSLQFEKSAKAELYLNRARSRWINQNKTDKYLPEIIIYSPITNYYTNLSKIKIKGKASDDTYISEIKVGYKNIRMDVSQKEADFQIQYPVKQGENVIPIIVQDIAGYTNTKNIIVHVDKLSPVLSLDKSVLYSVINEKILLIDLYSFDDSGIADLNIDNKKYIFQGKKSINFKKKVKIISNINSIHIIVKDIAGNIIDEYIDFNKFSERKNLLAINDSYPVLLNNYFSMKTKRIRESDTHETKIIFLSKIPEISYQNQIIVQGRVIDNDGIKALFLNGEEIKIFHRCNYKFKYIYDLFNEEENLIVIRAIDVNENRIIKQRVIKKKIPTIYSKASSILKIADFKDDPNNNLKLNKIFKQELFNQIKDIKRFKLINKDDQIKPDYFLTGDIVQMTNEIDVNLYIKRTKNEYDYIARINVFEEKKENEKINYYYKLGVLAKQAVKYLCQELPVVECKVVDIKGNKIFIEVDEGSMVKDGIIVDIYRKSIDKNFKVLGSAVINGLDDGKPYILASKNNTIQKGDYVRTR